MYFKAEWDKSYDTLMQEKIQSQMGIICRQKDELDIATNELWELMKKNPKRRYNGRK